jgi:integrase
MLTDAACRKAVPGDRDRKLADSGSLFLLIKKTGTKSWRWKYRFDGKEKQLVIGRYPAVSLAEARRERDAARLQLDRGTDPALAKQLAKAHAAASARESFEVIARSWHTAKKAGWNERYAGKILERMENDVFPQLGRLPIRDITPPVVLAAIRKIEARGALDMAHRVRMHMSEVFVWAIASGLADNDPAAIIRKALTPTNGKLRPAVTNIVEAKAVLAANDAVEHAEHTTRLASQLLALTAARPGMIRLAERHEFEDLDGESPIWRVPAVKMKLSRERKRDKRYEFVIPLSRQAVAIVKEALATNQPGDWLFPGRSSWTKPISEGTLNRHYRDAGHSGHHCPHGWRATFSTIMNELAAIEGNIGDREIIELMLAHIKGDVEAAYNRALYLPRRRELAQIWADMLMPG